MMIRGDGYKYYLNVEVFGFHSAGRAYFLVNNKRIFIEKVVPGDVINVKVAKRQKGYQLAELLQINQESELRAKPFCVYAHICGGCNWQYIQYQEQLKFKKQLLIEALEKYSIKHPEISDVEPSPKLQGYRNKLDFNFGVNENGEVIIGFHPLNKPYELFKVDECRLMPDKIIEIVKKYNDFINQNLFECYNYRTKEGILYDLVVRSSHSLDLMLILSITQFDQTVVSKSEEFFKKFPEITSFYFTLKNDSNKFYSDKFTKVFGKEKLEEKMGDLKFEISPAAFYQPNPLQAYQVYQTVKDFADLKPNDFVYDLYTGAGTIACFLADKAGKILGMEGSLAAIMDAIENVKRNQLVNLEFFQSDILEGFTKDFVDSRPKPDVIILDPPRAGTLIEIKKTILHAAPGKIIYVSCNPVSLAWDLKQLCEDYEISAIKTFDMFPHTHHLETVVLLERKPFILKCQDSI